MLTYVPPEKKKLPKSPEKPWLLFLLTFIWLWIGIFGRDLWDDEAKLYAYISSILENNQWLLPQIYDVAYVNNSPLYLWLGAIFKYIFGSLGISAYVSVRLLTVALMALSLIFIGLAARNFLGRRYGRVAVLITIGCIGIIIFGHQISQLPLLFLALALYSYAISSLFKQENLFFTGFLLAVSWTLVFYTANLIPLFLLLAISLLLIIHPFWRNKKYFLVLLIALAIFLPLASLWPNALYVVHPQIYAIWFNYYALDGYDGINFSAIIAANNYYLKNIIWYAFPAWPLAIWALIKLRKKLFSEPYIFFFLLWIVLGTLVIILQKKLDNNQLILIILPLIFLATSQIDTLKRGLSAFLNGFGITTFGLLAIFIWFEYIIINFELSAFIVEKSFYYNPFYQPKISIVMMAVALIFIPIWIYVVNRKRIEGRQAVTNWATGVTFIWLLMMSLFLSWIDTAKSFRPLVKDLEQTMPKLIQKELSEAKTCIDSKSLETLIAWNEYSDYKIHSAVHSTQKNCHFHLDSAELNEFKTQHPNIHILWTGERIRKKSRTFILWKE